MATSITVRLLLVISRATPGKLYRKKVVGLLELFYLLGNSGHCPASQGHTLCGYYNFYSFFIYFIFWHTYLPFSPGDIEEQILQIHKEKV